MKTLQRFAVATVCMLVGACFANAQGAATPGGLRKAPEIKIVNNRVTIETGIPYGFKEGLVRPETQRVLTFMLIGPSPALWAGESYLKEPCREIGTIAPLGEHKLEDVKLEVEYEKDGDAKSVTAVIGDARTDLPLHALKLESERQVRDQAYLPAEVGYVYAVRSYSMHGDEVLALVRVEKIDGRNLTLEQNVVKRWDKAAVEKRWSKRRAEYKTASSGSTKLDWEQPGFNFFWGTYGDLAISRGYWDISLWRNKAWQAGKGVALTPNIYKGRESVIYTLPKDAAWDGVTDKSAEGLAAEPHIGGVEKGAIYLLHIIHKGDVLKWDYWAAMRITETEERGYSFDWKMLKVNSKPPQKEKEWGEIAFAPCYGSAYDIYKTNHSVIFRD